MSISQLFSKFSTHRDVVPGYYVRSAGVFIVTGLAATNGGAIVLDDGGEVVGAFPTKRDALASVRPN